MIGEHGLWWKSSFYEPSVRVPLIAAWPGRIEGGSRVDTPVSLLDLTRTMVDVAGADADGIAGDNLFDSDLDADRAVFAEFEAHATDRPGRMVRRGRYKLNYYHGEQPELFDLSADPHEMVNLASDPAYANVRDDLIALVLDDWSRTRSTEESAKASAAVESCLPAGPRRTALSWSRRLLVSRPGLRAGAYPATMRNERT